MNFNLINYIGIDYKYHEDFLCELCHKIQGTIVLDEDIYELLSFTVSKKNIGYKCIEIFHDSNFEGDSYNGHLIIINNYFELNFEYSNIDSPSKINLTNHILYDSINSSLDEYTDENLGVHIYIADLFCSLINTNTIFYSINIKIYINEL